MGAMGFEIAGGSGRPPPPPPPPPGKRGGHQRLGKGRVNNLRSRSRQHERNVGSLTPPEILKGEDAWLQTVQQQFIGGVPKFKMLQKSLGLFYDENKILRCKGRISNANLL